jgi:uncharacterized small protein (DUF1192 family)
MPKQTKQTKQQLMDEIREYNDEAFYDNLRPLSMVQLRDYLAELQKEYPEVKAELESKHEIQR